MGFYGCLVGGVNTVSGAPGARRGTGGYHQRTKSIPR